MTATEILLLRHAEKPGKADGGPGFTPNGREDPKSLTIRGWQRAGALAVALAPTWSAGSDLPRPDRIHASAFRAGGGHSRRPEQTVLPLAQKLSCSIDLTWALHQEDAFGAVLARQTGTVLVCWQHQGLAALARAIVAPQRIEELPADWVWPEDRYDVIWSLRRNEPDGKWHFRQRCPALLSGDLNQPFSLIGEARSA